MNKNRIRGLRQRASGHKTAKPLSIKAAGGKSGGCARKAVELTSGGLRRVTEIVTEGEAIHPDRVVEVSSGCSSRTSDEGPNGRERQVAGGTR